MKNGVLVWDRFVRFFHWTLVAAFATSYLSGEAEHPVHAWSGYLILTLIVLRIAWGFVGSRHARFRNYLRSPREAWRYVTGLLRGRSPRSLGHNPAGAWMAALLLASLLATGVSGLKLYGIEGHGPLAVERSAEIHADAPGQSYRDDDRHDEEETWEEIHEFLANFTLFLVTLHIAGVIASSFAHHENLPRAMVTGYKRRQAAEPTP